jgi:branched-chain amino acid transport system substrate-binding protein
VFNTIVPPGPLRFLEQLYDSASPDAADGSSARISTRNLLSLVPAAQQGPDSCLDDYQGVSDPFSQRLLRQYNKLYPGSAQFTGGSTCSNLYAA